MCFAILDKDIQAFREKNSNASLDGWLREFHKEYDDGWFNANRVRLRETFVGHWNRATGENITVTKGASVNTAATSLLDGIEEVISDSSSAPNNAQAHSSSNSAGDLLDALSAPVRNSAPKPLPQPSGGADLLSLDSDAPTTTSTAAPAVNLPYNSADDLLGGLAASTNNVTAVTNATTNGLDDLLSLGGGAPQANNVNANNVTTAPKKPLVTAPKSDDPFSGLLNL